MFFNVHAGQGKSFVGIVKALNTDVGKKFRRNWKIFFQILQSFFGLKKFVDLKYLCTGTGGKEQDLCMPSLFSILFVDKVQFFGLESSFE